MKKTNYSPEDFLLSNESLNPGLSVAYILADKANALLPAIKEAWTAELRESIPGEEEMSNYNIKHPFADALVQGTANSPAAPLPQALEHPEVTRLRAENLVLTNQVASLQAENSCYKNTHAKQIAKIAELEKRPSFESNFNQANTWVKLLEKYIVSQKLELDQKASLLRETREGISSALLLDEQLAEAWDGLWKLCERIDAALGEGK